MLNIYCEWRIRRTAVVSDSTVAIGLSFTEAEVNKSSEVGCAEGDAAVDADKYTAFASKN